MSVAILVWRRIPLTWLQPVLRVAGIMTWGEVEQWYVEECPSLHDCDDKAWSRAAISSTESGDACRQLLLDHLMLSSLHWEERDLIGAEGMRELADSTEVKSHMKMVKNPPPERSRPSGGEKRSRPSSHDSLAVATSSIAVPTRSPSHDSAGMVTIPRADLWAIHETMERSCKSMRQMSGYFKAGSNAFDDEVSRVDRVMTQIVDHLAKGESRSSWTPPRRRR